MDNIMLYLKRITKLNKENWNEDMVDILTAFIQIIELLLKHVEMLGVKSSDSA